MKETTLSMKQTILTIVTNPCSQKWALKKLKLFHPCNISFLFTKSLIPSNTWGKQLCLQIALCQNKTKTCNSDKSINAVDNFLFRSAVYKPPSKQQNSPMLSRTVPTVILPNKSFLVKKEGNKKKVIDINTL